MVENIRQGDIPGVQLRHRQSLSAPAAVVWRWLTETDHLDRWLCRHAAIESSATRSLVLESTGPRQEIVRERLLPHHVERPHLLVYDLQRLDAGWPTATRLTLELTPTTGGTEISVLQQGFAHLPLSDCLTIWEAYRRRWRTALTRLADELATAPDS